MGNSSNASNNYNNYSCCGPCHSKPMLTDNEAENLIRDILFSLKIRDTDMEAFMSTVDTKINSKSLEKINTLKKWITPKVYEEILNEVYYFEKGTQIRFSEYHPTLVINYDSNENDRDFGLTLYSWALSLSMNSTSKVSLMYNIIKAFNSGYTGVDYENFTFFINVYLELNIRFFTEQIYKTVKYPTLKEQFEELLKIFSDQNVKKLEKVIIADLDNLIKRSKVINNISPHEHIDIPILEKLLDKHPYLMDCIELRCQFYNQYINSY